MKPREFDEKAVLNEMEKFWININGCRGDTLSVHIAKWQFEQDQLTYNNLLEAYESMKFQRDRLQDQLNTWRADPDYARKLEGMLK